MTLGIQIGVRSNGGRIRVVQRRGWRGKRVSTMEVELHGETFEDALVAVREQFGTVSDVAVAVDTESLFVKRVSLPPISSADKRRTLTVEPERFFPLRGDDVLVSLHDDANLVFAARTVELESWLAALESLGRIDRVEPAPCSLARVAIASGIERGALVTRNATGDLTTLVIIANRRLQTVRKLFGTARDAADALAKSDHWPMDVYVVPWSQADADAIVTALPGADPKPLPLGVLPDVYAVAYGVAGDGGSLDDVGLMPDRVYRRVVTRRRFALWSAAAAAVGAIIFALAAWDLHRTRTANWLTREIAAYEDLAAPSLSLRTEMAALESAATRIGEITATRSDPLRVFQLMTDLLPRDAWIRAVRNDGDEWEFDGYARDAAQLIPLLEASVEFDNVRFRTATSRAQFERQVYESFSLALRHVSPSE